MKYFIQRSKFNFMSSLKGFYIKMFKEKVKNLYTTCIGYLNQLLGYCYMQLRLGLQVKDH